MQRQILEQKILTNVHAVSENRLHSIATGLVTTLNKSVEDLDGLHHKLGKKTIAGR